jgi:hypothetical protein
MWVEPVRIYIYILEFEHLVLLVSQLFEDPANLALLHALLLPSDGQDLPRRTCNHSLAHEDSRAKRRKRTTDEHLDFVAELGWRDMRLDELAADVTRRACPSLWGFIERVYDAQGSWVGALERAELLTQEDIRL